MTNTYIRLSRAEGKVSEGATRKVHKLVRDRIPEIIQNEGRTPIVTTLNGKELVSALQEKLLEETEEYLNSEDQEEILSELADILEVIRALSAAHGFGEQVLIDAAERKREERGGFSKGFFYKGCS